MILKKYKSKVPISVGKVKIVKRFAYFPKRVRNYLIWWQGYYDFYQYRVVMAPGLVKYIPVKKWVKFTSKINKND